MMKTLLSGIGGLTAAFGSAVCCSGPVVLASLGMSGAALSAWRPYRPLFVIAAVGLLWLAFQWQSKEAAGACGMEGHDADAEGACGCADPLRARRNRAILMVIAVLSGLLLISPRWVSLVF
jgi:mercuric ion transport protein